MKNFILSCIYLHKSEKMIEISSKKKGGQHNIFSKIEINFEKNRDENLEFPDLNIFCCPRSPSRELANLVPVDGIEARAVVPR